MVATVGGPVDEVRVSLAVYSDNLDPDLLTRLLGCAPSTFHLSPTRGPEARALDPVFHWCVDSHGRVDVAGNRRSGSASIVDATP
jgi:hypothetical protein